MNDAHFSEEANMQNINLKKLEDQLNAITMDDAHNGYRPAHAAAQLYFGRNDISNAELTQVEAALDVLVQEEELDHASHDGTKIYRSQKFGSKRDEYMSMLEQRALQAEQMREAAARLETLMSREKEPFFDRDYVWYLETA